MWDPEIIPSANVITNKAPTNPRENLYWASLVRARYGTYDFGSKVASTGTIFYNKTDGIVVKNRIGGASGNAVADPTAQSKAPVQFWN